MILAIDRGVARNFDWEGTRIGVCETMVNIWPNLLQNIDYLGGGAPGYALGHKVIYLFLK